MLVVPAVRLGVDNGAVAAAALLLVLSELGFAAALAHGLYDAAIYLQLVGQRVA